MNCANATRAADLADDYFHASSALPETQGQPIDCAFLDRLHASRVQPDDLAAIVACTHFELLPAICRLVRKVLAVRNG